jgi:hypothetical protein
VEPRPSRDPKIQRFQIPINGLIQKSGFWMWDPVEDSESVHNPIDGTYTIGNQEI